MEVVSHNHYLRKYIKTNRVLKGDALAAPHIHCLKKTVQTVFCQNFVEFRPWKFLAQR